MIAAATTSLRPSRSHPRGEINPAYVTYKERQVWVLIADGLTNKVIADLMGVSIRTTHKHRAMLFLKLRCNCGAMLARRAVDYGIVPHLDKMLYARPGPHGARFYFAP